MQLYLPNSARLQNIEAFLSRFDPGDPQTLEFSMHERWVAVHPAVLAFTASLADSVAQQGGDHQGQVHDVRSLPYLVRMGLFEHVHIDPGIEITEHEQAGRFIPLQRISSGAELSDFIVDMIPLLHADKDDVEPIQYVISELVRNVLEHARSPGCAFVCAQYYPAKDVLSIGVSDCGIGIQSAMSRFHRVPTAWDALVLALRPGVSGTTARIGGTDYNMGAGLFFTKSIACASRNYFVLYSGDALFKLKPLPVSREVELQANPLADHHTKRTGLPFCQGTLVGIDITLGRDMVFKELLRAIGRAFQLDVKQKTKEVYKRPRFM